MANIVIERKLIDLVKYPIITDKTTKLIEENQYCFAVDNKASKLDIKAAIEYIFNVRVQKINTMKGITKKRRIGKFFGKKTSYKKAIIKLHEDDNIELFPDS
uniref:Large ribosomal subunit protein uL23c n=1 Tax=Phyllymenia taiwanensis TaxID=1260292 RepID=R9XZJ7_9FLOR|nr:50S ribosomal protein L23 [Grateloupia taiwanensis]AGO19883.1 50S ribosomal protein L23 [Grateloupia taiwanensis]